VHPTQPVIVLSKHLSSQLLCVTASILHSKELMWPLNLYLFLTAEQQDISIVMNNSELSQLSHDTFSSS
jgi:hypothetical protein